MSTVLVCPSHGRADRVRTLEITDHDHLSLCVAKSQAPLYAERHPDVELHVHPDDVIGLASKRNWVLERFKGDDVFMVDDDILSWRHLTSVPGLLEYVRPNQVLPIVTRTFAEAADIGAYLIGYAPVADTRTFSPLKPFQFTGYVAGHASGLRAGHGLWYHVDCIQEDWWISLLNAYFHRVCLVDHRYGAYQKATFKGIDGLGAHRTVGSERKGYDLLRRHFGSVVVHKKGTATHPARPWSVSMKLPY